MSLPRTTRSCGERAAVELPEHVTSGTYGVRLLKKFRSRREEMQHGSPEGSDLILRLPASAGGLIFLGEQILDCRLEQSWIVIPITVDFP